MLALLLCHIVALASATLTIDNGTSSYIYLPLPSPLNWVPAKLYDPPVVETFYKPYESYNASGWARYVLAECESLNGGSCVSYSELTTGAYMTENATRIWWGIVYGSDTILTLDNFRRDVSENDVVENAQVAVLKASQTSTPAVTTSTSASATVAPTTVATGTGQSASSSAGTATNPTAATVASGASRRNEFARWNFVMLIAAIVL